MTAQFFDTIKRSMDEQLERKHYPKGFPALPSIPTARYKDPVFAEREMRLLWRKTWLLVGVESELPEVGSYFLFEQLGQSIILVRERSGSIRAFHNTCQHRGAALVSKPKGRVRLFMCPYHAWSYALDGALASVPGDHNFACLVKSDRGLRSVKCETWRGLVFINLDPEAKGVTDFMAPAQSSLPHFPFEGLVVQDHYTRELDCNWKLAYHNFIEGYHTKVVHPTTLAPYLDPETFNISLLENGHSRIAVSKRQGGSLYVEGDVASKGIETPYHKLSLVLSNFPNAFLALDPGGFAIQTFWPAGPNRSVMEVRLVGWDTSPSDPAYWLDMRQAFDAILAEDMSLFAAIQRSIDNEALPAITVGYLERALYWLEEEIDRTMGPTSVPENMRVAPVLSGHADRPPSMLEAG